MDKDVEKLLSSMSSADIKELLRTKEQVEGINVEALETFGIKLSDWSLSELKMLSKAAVSAIKDGRATLKLPMFLRLEPIYKIKLDQLGTVSNASFSQIITALAEAILMGDIVVQRRPSTKEEFKLDGQKYRVDLLNRKGILINTTNMVDRPSGVKL